MASMHQELLIARIIFVLILVILVKSDTQPKELKDKNDMSGDPQPPRIQTRVWHGNVTANGVLGGFAVQIFYVTKLICTGTLLSQRHFISAAHCFENLTVSYFHVVAGETVEREDFLPTQRKNFLLKLKIHPDFNKLKFIADIAVAKTRLVMKSKYIGYARICSVKLFPRDKVTVAGWGVSSNRNVSYHSNPLRTMKTSIVSKMKCEEKLGRRMPPNILCAMANNGHTLCTGDSGGPLIFLDQVCGVNTWTWKCGEGKKPDVYMSVLYYAKFIKQTIKQFGN